MMLNSNKVKERYLKKKALAVFQEMIVFIMEKILPNFWFDFATLFGLKKYFERLLAFLNCVNKKKWEVWQLAFF